MASKLGKALNILSDRKIQIFIAISGFLLLLLILAYFPAIPLPFGVGVLYLVKPIAQAKIKILLYSILFFYIEFLLLSIYIYLISSLIKGFKKFKSWLDNSLTKITDFLDSVI